ncbi:MAG: hypothetical protein D6828_03045, partial [Nitrospirae bacterium]
IRLIKLGSDVLLTPLFGGYRSIVSSVAFSPDGEMIASGGWDGTVRLWSTKGEEILKPLRGHKGVVSSVAFSPDGEMIASGGWDGTVRLWKSR